MHLYTSDISLENQKIHYPLTTVAQKSPVQ